MPSFSLVKRSTSCHQPFDESATRVQIRVAEREGGHKTLTYDGSCCRGRRGIKGSCGGLRHSECSDRIDCSLDFVS
jgi:hypothetical protein